MRAQSLLNTHNKVLFERRHNDLLKLQKYARTVNIDDSEKSENPNKEEGSILLGRDDDPFE